MRVTGGFLKNRVLQTPKGKSTRPTAEKMRQSIFNILQDRMIKASVLDLFAGSGAMGIEALSRGANHATFIENHPLALACLRSNVKLLELQKLTTVMPYDARLALKKLIKQGVSFDFIYMDPPYEKYELQETSLNLIDQSSLLKRGGVMFVEVSINRTLEDRENVKIMNKREIGSSALFEYSAPITGNCRKN